MVKVIEAKEHKAYPAKVIEYNGRYWLVKISNPTKQKHLNLIWSRPQEFLFSGPIEEGMDVWDRYESGPNLGLYYFYKERPSDDLT